MDNKDNFNLKKDQNGNISLFRGDTVTLCMKNPAIVLPGKLQGQLEVQRMPCNSACPFFNFAELQQKGSDKKTEGVVLECMEKPKFIPISSKQESFSKKLSVNKN